MKQYQKWNNIIGWFVFIFASLVYILTSEPTASFWDCGEYISTAYKLQVGHPPGAPLFQIIGRFFSLFAFGHTQYVARMVNTMTALASGATILFLFWSITMMVKKFVISPEEKHEPVSLEKMLVIFGSALVGSLAYTFCDSFWFSAVEGEVYGMSSFFTAIVFWAMLKWEIAADTDKYNLKWILLIAFLMGLSIGVHLLNLLTIPAMAYIYYFKKYKPTIKGFLVTGFVSLVLLGFVQAGIIPWVVILAGKFEIFFVNNFGLPFNSGTIIYFILLIGAIVWGLIYTHKHKKVIANTVILCIMFIIIGYSTFFMLVIRSNAATPINENKPVDAPSLLAFLLREQYGDWPILYGPYYNAPIETRDLNGDGKPDSYEDGSPVYEKDEAAGKYVVIDERKDAIPVYDSRFCTLFPRMWSPSSDYLSGYKRFGKITGEKVLDDNGEPIVNEKGEPILKPTFGENLRYFFTYQLGYMYFRYFMWNFSGKQNDIQGHGGPLEGNWITGIKWVDEKVLKLGPQDNLPESLENNKGRNKYYLLPFILGIIGIFYHSKVNYKDALILFFLFLLTGIAINVYLNPVCWQPRERDYAYVGSFYPFCMWIGMSVVWFYELFKKKINPKAAAIVAIIISFFGAPYLMGKGGWDDHDRSGRYTCRDFASNYLNSCDKNSVLFTNGDNDTFPLWYAQEVEGIRTDVRVCNLSLFNTDWYIDEMKRKAYDSDPLPISLTRKQYHQGTREYVYMAEDNRKADPSEYQDLKKMIDFVGSDEPENKFRESSFNYFPTKKFKVPVDKANFLAQGKIPRTLVDSILPSINWKLNKNGVYKNQLMVLDMIANNNWKRPIYFANTSGGESSIGLDDYFLQEGLAYHLVPIKIKSNDGQPGGINTDVMYDNVMNKFKWGNMQSKNVYLNEDVLRMTWNFKMILSRLATALIDEGKKDSAIKVCDRAFEVMPENNVPLDYFSLGFAEVYIRAGELKKADLLISKLIKIYEHDLAFYNTFSPEDAASVEYEKDRTSAIIQRISQVEVELVNAYYKNGSKDKADKIISGMINNYSRDLSCYSSLAGNYATSIVEQSLSIMQRLGQMTKNNNAELSTKINGVFNKYMSVYSKNKSMMNEQRQAQQPADESMDQQQEE